MLKKSVLSFICILAFAGLVCADAITTSETVNSPAFLPGSNVISVDAGAGATREYVNSSGGAVGDTTRSIGASLLSTYTTGTGTLGTISIAGGSPQIVATFAAIGTITSAPGTGFSAAYTAGHIQVWQLPAGTNFNITNPATWGPTTAGAIQLASYNLNPNAMNLFPGPNGEAIFVGAGSQNQASVSFTNIGDVSGQFQFSKVFDNLLTPPLPFDGQQVKVTSEFTSLTGSSLTGTGEAGLNATWVDLFGGGFFSNASDPFDPNGTGANGDFITNLGVHADPTLSVVPEIDPASMAGALTMLGAGWMLLTGRRRRK
jgi:hypothetical protein